MVARVPRVTGGAAMVAAQVAHADGFADGARQGAEFAHEAAQIFGSDACSVALCFVVCDALVGAAERGLQALQLQHGKVVAGYCFYVD
jgi:hypothetical protein